MTREKLARGEISSKKKKVKKTDPVSQAKQLWGKKYPIEEITTTTDDGGKCLDLLFPDYESASIARKELPHSWNGYRVLVKYYEEKDTDEEE